MVQNFGFLQVRVFTFAVGPPAESTEALRNMACNNRGEPNLYVASDHLFPVNAGNWYGKLTSKTKKIDILHGLKSA